MNPSGKGIDSHVMPPCLFALSHPVTQLLFLLVGMYAQSPSTTDMNRTQPDGLKWYIYGNKALWGGMAELINGRHKKDIGGGSYTVCACQEVD